MPAPTLDHVRWKPYGFTHLAVPGTDRTLCGSEWGWPWSDLLKWHGDRVLPPGPDDERRPVCGLCRKYAASAG